MGDDSTLLGKKANDGHFAPMTLRTVDRRHCWSLPVTVFIQLERDRTFDTFAALTLGSFLRSKASTTARASELILATLGATIQAPVSLPV
jgi:hypothetical protein